MAYQNSGSNVTIDSDAVFTTVATIPIQQGFSNLWFDFDLTADAALTAFNTDVKAHASGNWHTIASTAAHYAPKVISDLSPVRETIGTPVTLSKSTSCLLWLDVKGLDSVRFQAKAGASDAIVSDFYWQQR